MTLRSDPDQPYQPWETLPDRWQRIYRVQAEAVRGVLKAESDIADEPDVASGIPELAAWCAAGPDPTMITSWRVSLMGSGAPWRVG